MQTPKQILLCVKYEGRCLYWIFENSILLCIMQGHRIPIFFMWIRNLWVVHFYAFLICKFSLLYRTFLTYYINFFRHCNELCLKVGLVFIWLTEITMKNQMIKKLMRLCNFFFLSLVQSKEYLTKGMDFFKVHMYNYINLSCVVLGEFH